jgi:hypothetical protein
MASEREETREVSDVGATAIAVRWGGACLTTVYLQGKMVML